VRRLAAKRDLVTLDAERPDHGPERESERLEHRPLLDVELEVGGGALELSSTFPCPVELDAVLGQSVRKGDAFLVVKPSELVRIERSRAGARAEEAAAEPRALLVGPVDEPDRCGWGAVLGDPAENLDGGHHVERAVEPAAVRDGVDVTADYKRAVGVAPQREPLVPGLVDLVVGRDAGELLAEPLAGARPRLRPRDALRAVLVRRELL
jgi:hypothetical protein